MFNYKYTYFIFLLLIILILPIVSTATDSVYVWSNNTTDSLQTSLQITSDTSNSLNLESGSAILIEQNSRSSTLRT